MRVLVTGATGFVGRWLAPELTRAGHEVHGAPPSARLDIADGPAVHALVRSARPDVIAHLASTASRQDAERDPSRALELTIGGTCAVVRAAASLEPPAGVLLVSSAEVYGAALAAGDPVGESRAPEPTSAYGFLKLSMEAVARAEAAVGGVGLVIVRPFNHVGPGQRQPSAPASFAARVREVRRGTADAITVGNLDVERDIADVRDVVVAYRLLLEQLEEGRLGRPPAVFNIGTGRSVRLGDVLTSLCRLDGVSPAIRTDPALLRHDDPPRVVADISAVTRATGWRATTPLETTLADILGSLDADT